jgi:uncharacterized protein (TIGR00297 family)
MADLIIVKVLIGFVITLLFGIIAFVKEMVDDTGFVTGVILFTFTYVFLDWQAYVIVIIFFLISGISINIENKYKAEKGEFELYKAKRNIQRVSGRCLAGAIFGLLFFATSRPEFQLAFVASYAESAFDTVSTKLGKLLSREAWLITNFKAVHRGTPGAISWQGTLCGILAALILGISAFVVRLINLPDLFVAILAALLGSAMDSFLNTLSYQKRPIPNEFINFFSSMAAGIAACYMTFGVKG